jgi:hypothetical protein
MQGKVMRLEMQVEDMVGETLYRAAIGPMIVKRVRMIG